jgi:hypothetical protein
MDDPDFKPEEGKTKEESAWALCNWLNNEGRLSDMLDGSTLVARDPQALLAQGSRTFRVALPLMRVDAPEWGDQDGLWIRVEASGPERDTYGSRMSSICLERMIDYVDAGIDGQPLPFLDGHYMDLLAAMLGDVHAPYLTDEQHFAFYANLDTRNPQAIRLYDDLGRGKRHGASIAGWAHEFEEETWSDDDGDHVGIVFHDLELMEISRTSWPSWQPAFCDLVAGKMSTVLHDFSISRRARQVSNAVVYCKPDGSCVQLVDDDGKANLLTLYASTIALTEVFSPELIGQEPNILLEGLLDSGLVDSEAVLQCSRSSAAFFTELPLEERVKLGKQVVGVFSSHLQRTAPLPLVMSLGRASDKLEMYDLVRGTIDNQEERVMGVQDKQVAPDATVTTGVEPGENVQAAAVAEEAPDNGQAQADQPAEVRAATRGILADTVDARMLGQRFAEATWAMQDLVWNELYDTDNALDDRVNRAEAVINEFAEMAIGLVSQMAQSGYVPRSADELRQLSTASVELSEGRLTTTRIEMIRSRVAALFQEGVDLMEILDRSDEEIAAMATEPEPDADDELDPEQIEASEVASSLLDERLQQMAAERQQTVEQVFDRLRSASAAPQAPTGQPGPGPAATPDAAQEQNLAATKGKFLASLPDGGQRRRVGARRPVKRPVPQQPS